MSLSTSSKNSVLLITEKIIVLGISFLVSILLARIGGKEVFGQYAYITSFVGLFAPLCVMGLNNIPAKYFIKYPKNSHYFIKSSLMIRAIGALFSILVGIFIVFLLNIEQPSSSLITYLLLLQGFQLFYVFEYYFLANNKVGITLRVRLFVLSLSGLLKVIVILNGADLTTLILLHGASYLVIAIGYLILYQKSTRATNYDRPVSATTVFALFHKGKWLLLSGIAAVIYLKIDQVMIAYFHTNEAVGVYAAAAKLSEFWYVFPVLIANAFNRQLTLKHREDHEQFKQFTVKLLSLLVASAVLISALTYLLADWIITFFYGNNFSESATILTIHICTTVFIFQRAIFSKWLIIKSLYKYSLFTHGLGAISNIVLNLLLIPMYSSVGAAWATLISYVIASYLSLFFVKETRSFALTMTYAMLTWPFNIQLSLLTTKRLKGC